MIRGVIFDIDGVLLDSMGIWNDLGARYLRARGYKPEDGLNDILFSMSMEQGAEYLKATYGVPGTAEEILSAIEDMLRAFYWNEVQAKPGAKELLETLCDEGIAIAAATSSPREHVEKALERNGLLHLISRIYTTSEEQTSKHMPDIYLKAASHLGIRPNETIVAEDSLYALRTARTAGFVTVGVYDPAGEKDQAGLRDAADFYIKDLRETLSAVKE